MKKKPPPGATLIARLKERRSLKEKQGANEDSTNESVLEVEAKEISATEGLIPGEQLQMHNREDSPGNLINRSIGIEDLRPVSEDYEALTEEIKLAGRFAAVGLIAQGLRLSRLHDAEIYKQHYPSFEEYCRREHQMSATYAYRLIRMSEMAEAIASSPHEAFETMLNLGHRHLMALLPLAPETAEDLLLKGLPQVDQEKSGRVPLAQATERQIKDALRSLGVSAESMSKERDVRGRSGKILKELSRVVTALEQVVDNLDERQDDLREAKIGGSSQFQDLLKRFRTASEKINNFLDS